MAEKTITVTCSYCNGAFVLNPSVYRTRIKHSKNNTVYCSRNCAGLARRKRDVTYKCDNCGEKISMVESRYNYRIKKSTHKKIFCDRQCKATYFRDYISAMYIERADEFREYCRLSGRKHGKLTAEQVRELRKDYANHESMYELVRKYGISVSSIRQLIRGKSYRWVE